MSTKWRAANKEKAKTYDAAYDAAHKEKIKAHNAARYAANSEKMRAASAAWRAANPEKIKAQHRMRKFRVSPDCFQLMLAVQQNACGICNKKFSKTPHIDHCHKTGEVRGLLCGSCNKGMGFFKDSPLLLKSTLEYLTNYNI